MFPTSILNNNVVMSDNRIIKANDITEYLKTNKFAVAKDDNLFMYTVDSSNGEGSKIRIPRQHSLPAGINSLNQVLLGDGSILSVALMDKIYNKLFKPENFGRPNYQPFNNQNYNTVIAKKPLENFSGKMKMAGPGEHYATLNVNNMTPFHSANGDKFFRVGNAYGN